MKEYKIAKVWAIILYILAPFVIALFGCLLLLPIIPGMENELPKSSYWGCAIFSIIIIIPTVLAVLETFKGKVVITKNKIFTISVFSSNRELLFSEIKGYRIREKMIFIEPISESKKKIKISTYFGKTDEIKKWLSSNYSDLDTIEATNELHEILNNAEFGWSKKQREEKLHRAFKVAKILNWIGGLIGIWALVFPKPYQYAIIASIVFPFFIVIILKYFNGLIKLDTARNTAFPSVFLALFLTCLAVCIRALIDFHIYDYSNVWAPVILITLVYVVVLTIGKQPFRLSKTKDLFSLMGFILLIFCYSYGVIVTLNCIYDKSKPELFKATILDKRIGTGKTTMYYVKLTPWKQQTESTEIRVLQDFYNNLNINTEVDIHYMKGKFEIPWFEITQ